MIPERHRKTAVWVTVCVALCGASEGVRTTAYKDVGGIPTLCYGETKGIHLGQTATPQECKDWLGERVLEFGREVDRCTKVEMPPERKAAMVDFAYNEGSARYCKYIAPLINADKPKAACDELLSFTTAGGITFPGLVARRNKERVLCMVGLI